ncbi:MAG TPA: HAMP domain-containing sensor histidine kinase [Longimicrobium sp.]|nr:HAMP domain-containing sensor histidine kinase [Longimicrobium sp.]
MPNGDQHLDFHLLANFVHQVINPLNGVIGTLDNIIDGTVPAIKRDQRLRAVRAQLEWSVLLVRNLAYFTKISLNPGASIEPDRSRTCVIPQLVIEAAQFFQEPGLSRGVTIHLEDRTTQYAVPGAPDLLRQVFMNLFDNAVKYADEESDVRIRPWIQKKTGHLLLEIENKGAGFSRVESERLFEVGFRGVEAEKRVASGTGLGLYICRRIMEDVHDATIEAEHSKATRTTTFRLRFPDWRIL